MSDQAVPTDASTFGGDGADIGPIRIRLRFPYRLDSFEGLLMTLLKERVTLASGGTVRLGSPFDALRRPRRSATEQQLSGIVTDTRLAELEKPLRVNRIPFLCDSFRNARLLDAIIRNSAVEIVEIFHSAEVLLRFPGRPVGLWMTRQPTDRDNPLHGLRILDPDGEFGRYAERFGAVAVGSEQALGEPISEALLRAQHIDAIWCAPRDLLNWNLGATTYYLDLQCWFPSTYVLVPGRDLVSISDVAKRQMRNAAISVEEDAWRFRERDHLADLAKLNSHLVKVVFPTMRQRAAAFEITKNVLQEEIAQDLRVFGGQLVEFQSRRSKPDGEPKAIEVYFATNARWKPSDKSLLTGRPLVAFQRRRSNRITFGVALVLLPEGRTSPRSVPVPPGMPFDPERHGGLIECQILTPEAFHECLLQEDAADDLCYVHGWNVPPEDALSEAADFATGVRFAGVPLVAIWSQKVDDPGPAARLGRQALEPFASWLVRGRGRPVIAALLKTANRFNLTPASYRRASDAIIGADPPLIELIGQLERIGKRHNLVAHSMGNRVALLALKVKSLTTASTTFVAPDVSSDEFRDLVQRLPAAAGLKSVYFSKNDIALMISESANHARRAGQGGPEIETMDFAEAIDVSDVKADPSGHSYHRFSGSVAEDIGDIVVGRLSAGRRFPRIRPVRAFWTISDLI